MSRKIINVYSSGGGGFTRGIKIAGAFTMDRGRVLDRLSDRARDGAAGLVARVGRIGRAADVFDDPRVITDYGRQLAAEGR